MTQALPALFQIHQFDRAILDRDPAAAEALEERGYYDVAEKYFSKFRTKEGEVERVLMVDRDLTAEARSRKAVEFLTTEGAKVSAALEHEIEALRTDRQRAEVAIREASYPAPEADLKALLREIRIAEARRQLEPMTNADRVRVILGAAQSGDLVPTLAAETSYSPLVPAQVTSTARESYARAVAPDVAARLESLRAQEAKAERLKVEIEARIASTVRRFGLSRAAA